MRARRREETVVRERKIGMWCAAAIAFSIGTSRVAAQVPAASRPPPTPVRTTLVLYDESGEWGWLGELYAVNAGNLASHFGRWRAMPVRNYRAGDLSRVDAAIYVGSTYDEPLPEAFLDDVRSGRTPVLWAGGNVWQLANRDDRFAERYGFEPLQYDPREFTAVRYKGVSLTRDRRNDGRLLAVRVAKRGPAKVIATAVGEGDVELPWAVRSRNLTYVAEIPFTYTSETDRYLAFCDLLFDLLAPETPERHRALVRIEDVMPTDDPARLRALADALAAEGVPFGVAVVPRYVDPNAAYSDDGLPQTVSWSDVPETAAALWYMLEKGGVLVMHGYTHQYRKQKVPYSSVSGDDFEFWMAHLDDQDRVVYDGPVPDDSAEWATERVRRGLHELERAGLRRPRIFEYPHYAGSATASRAIARVFQTAYHRGLYFSGVLRGGPTNPARSIGQFFPYDVTDVYGWRVIPENLGHYAPEAHNQHERRLPADIIRSARVNRVVRDGFASFFFHGHYEPEVLVEIVRAIKHAGYTFVSPASLTDAPREVAEADASRRSGRRAPRPSPEGTAR
jgi:uncharacterized protein YdaL